jgi:hypothetical protein
LSKALLLATLSKVNPTKLQNTISGNFFGIEVKKEHSFPSVKKSGSFIGIGVKKG